MMVFENIVRRERKFTRYNFILSGTRDFFQFFYDIMYQADNKSLYCIIMRYYILQYYKYKSNNYDF